MQELLRFPYKERRRLYRNVEFFFMVAKNQKVFQPVLEILTRKYGIKYKTELAVLVSGTTQALRYNSTKFSISRDRSSYYKLKQFTNQTISYTKMMELLDKLENGHYLVQYKGYYISEDDNMKSFIDLQADWLVMFDKEKCKQFGIARILDNIQVVCTSEVYKMGKKYKVVEDLPTIGIKGIRNKRRALIDYNKLLGDTIVEIDNTLCSNITYKRQFERTLYWHGRYYTIGTFQAESGEVRSTIRINGDVTSEVDISATHPRILYSIAGVKLDDDFDPYKIDEKFECDQQELRSFCKIGLLCILYNKSKKLATSALSDKLVKDRYKDNPEFKSLHKIEFISKKVISGLLKTNSKIEHLYFKKDLWMVLQNYDASICEFVINYFTNKKIPVLSIHDSWVIATKHSGELCSVIEQAWASIVPNNLNCKYKFKFKNTPTQQNAHPAFEEIPVEYYEE